MEVAQQTRRFGSRLAPHFGRQSGLQVRNPACRQGDLVVGERQWVGIAAIDGVVREWEKSPDGVERRGIDSERAGRRPVQPCHPSPFAIRDGDRPRALRSIAAKRCNEGHSRPDAAAFGDRDEINTRLGRFFEESVRHPLWSLGQVTQSAIHKNETTPTGSADGRKRTLPFQEAAQSVGELLCGARARCLQAVPV